MPSEFQGRVRPTRPSPSIWLGRLICASSYNISPAPSPPIGAPSALHNSSCNQATKPYTPQPDSRLPPSIRLMSQDPLAFSPRKRHDYIVTECTALSLRRLYSNGLLRLQSE